jgi:hypothetical protein
MKNVLRVTHAIVRKKHTSCMVYSSTLDMEARVSHAIVTKKHTSCMVYSSTLDMEARVSHAIVRKKHTSCMVYSSTVDMKAVFLPSFFPRVYFCHALEPLLHLSSFLLLGATKLQLWLLTIIKG